MTAPGKVITGDTVCYPLIGHPVAQVRTPPLINAWFASQAIDATMFAIDVAPEKVAAFLDGLRDWRNCGGCSVTVPHKQAAFRAMDRVTPRAAQVGAVNIVRRDSDGRLNGDMTDGLAFVAALAAGSVPLAGAAVLLAGAGGGAGMAIAFALAEAGVGRLTLQEPDESRLAKTMTALANAFPSLALDSTTPVDGFDIAVNASPLGMNPGDPLPFDPAVVHGGGVVADVVTKPGITPLLAAAAARGLSIQTGGAMADAQLPFQMRHLGLWPDGGNSTKVA